MVLWSQENLESIPLPLAVLGPFRPLRFLGQIFDIPTDGQRMNGEGERGRCLNALNSPLSSSRSFAPASLLEGIGQEKLGCPRDAGVGKPSACRLIWGSLRLLEPQAILIFKFGHQQFMVDVTEGGFLEASGNLPGPLAKLQCTQSCVYHHTSSGTSPTPCLALCALTVSPGTALWLL